MNQNRNFNVVRRVLLSSFFLFMGFLTAGHSQADMCGTQMDTPLIAGQHIEVGAVTVNNDENFVYVTYRTDGNWAITETHLDVATNPNDLKQTGKGNAIPGGFAYKTDHDPGVVEVTHTLDHTSWPAGTELYFAAHAVVESGTDSETAWANGIDFPGKNWAMYFGYTLQLCEEPPVFPGTIEFQDPNLTVMENLTSVTVTLVRTDGSDGDVSVEIVSSDIDATDGDDYAGVTTTVMFADGETTQQVEVLILDDQVDEPDEQFQLQLVNVVGADIGSQDKATITITDDDETPPLSVLSLEDMQFITSEGDGAMTIQVLRSQSTEGQASVDFKLNPGSAGPGTDYADNTGTVVFDHGEWTKPITINILDDTIVEPSPEFFSVELYNPVGATLGSPSVGDILIFDDDTDQ